MTPLDILVFQILGGLFTISFMALCLLVLRLMQGMEQGCNELLAAADRLEMRWSPILEDLQAGAAHFRATGALARQGAEGFADLGGQASRLSSFTKFGAKGVWAILAQAAGAFFNRKTGDRHE